MSVRLCFFDVIDGVGRFALGLAVVDFDLADGFGRGDRLLLEGPVAQTDVDNGGVHRVAHAVLAGVYVGLDGLEQFLEVFVIY